MRAGFYWLTHRSNNMPPIVVEIDAIGFMWYPGSEIDSTPDGHVLVGPLPPPPCASHPTYGLNDRKLGVLHPRRAPRAGCASCRAIWEFHVAEREAS